MKSWLSLLGWEFAATYAVLAAAIALVGPWGDFPLNDDWVYALDAVRSAQTGKLWFTGYEMAWGLPQTVVGCWMVEVFQSSHAQLRVFGILNLFAAALLLLLLLRRLQVNAPRLLPVLLIYCFFPAVFLNALTFMTDPFFATLWLAGILSALVYLEKGGAERLIPALLVTLLATLQRQYGVAGFVGIGLIYCCRRCKQRTTAAETRVFVGGLGLALVLLVAVAAWRGSAVTPGGSASALTLKPERWVRNLNSVFLYSGWFWLPLLPLVWKTGLLRSGLFQRQRDYRATLLQCLLLGSLLLTILRALRGELMPTWGNQISEYGVFQVSAVLHGARAVQIPALGRVLLTILCWLAAAVGTLAAGQFILPNLPRTWSDVVRFDWLRPGTFCVLACGIYLGAVVIRTSLFDRYLVPFAPALMVLAACMPQQKARVRVGATAMLVVAQALMTVTLAKDYFDWNDARWVLGARAVKEFGVAATEIEGGYEWDGWHRLSGHMPPDLEQERYVLAFSPLDGYETLAEQPYQSWWPPHARRLFFLKRR